MYYDLKRVGVAIRTVADDEYLSNEMLVGFASAQAAKYSRDLSESVTRAKRRQAERGEHLGGPMPLGYRLAEKKWVVVDPETAPLVKRIFELASQGVPDAAVARTINQEGLRTRKGQPFTRRLVQHMVCNAFYAARIEYDGDSFDAQHAPLIEAEVRPPRRATTPWWGLRCRGLLRPGRSARSRRSPRPSSRRRPAGHRGCGW
ncbi:MAG: recombinase family protein [Thermoleophilaceae bacterium]|nr:recombinase family protein [Thermoleophilaceae bacterium]